MTINITTSLADLHIALDDFELLQSLLWFRTNLKNMWRDRNYCDVSLVVSADVVNGKDGAMITLLRNLVVEEFGGRWDVLTTWTPNMLYCTVHLKVN